MGESISDSEYLDIYKLKPCLAGYGRKDITATLSHQLELQVLARRNAWACWASEVKLPPDERRVDYVDFCPHPSISCCSVGAVERGKFTFFEIKSCMSDLKSGNGTNWSGDENWLVCPVELAEEMRQRQIWLGVGILAYGQRKNGTRGFAKLHKESADRHGHGYRRYSAAELLYAMTRAGIRDGIT